MKLKRLLLLAAILFALPCLAQTAPAPSIWQNFSVTGSAAGFLGSSGGSQTAVLAGGWFQASNRVSLGYEQIMIPATASFDFGMAQYGLPLNALLGKKISAKLKFDASQETVSFFAGAGKVLQSSNATGSVSVNRIAETVGVKLTLPINSTLSLNVLSAQFVHGGTTNGLITTPSTSVVSSGLKVTF